MSKFGELINAQVPVLIDFYTEWNEASVSMHPVIRDVAAALGDKAKVIKIDDKGRIDLSIKAMQVKEVKPPVHREEDFEKKLTNFMKFSDEKIADLNSKCKDPRGTKRRTGNSSSGKK